MLTKGKWTPAKVFCLIAALGMVSLAACMVFTHGMLWGRLFWQDFSNSYNDTGMDFFHSIEYLKGNDPYGHWNTLYPPLANWFFKCLYRMVPEFQSQFWSMDYQDSVSMRCTQFDLRVWMPTLMLYILTFVLVTVFTFALIAAYYRKQKLPAAATAFCAVFSYGFVFALERGNIILIAIACALFFVLFHDAEDRKTREIALILLAVSANLKLYPALLGLLLLQERRWKEAARAILYGVLLFVLPCFAFEGGLDNIPLIFRNTLGVANRVVHENTGTAFVNFLSSIHGILTRLWGIGIPWLLRHSRKFSFLCLFLGIAASFLLKKKWQRSLGLILAFLLFSNQEIYGTCFLTIPLVQFLGEEEQFTRRNILPFTGFIIATACLPVFNAEGNAFSWTSFRLQIGMIILSGCLLASGIRILIHPGKPVSRKRQA